jgi:hypothetical protein
MAALSGTAASGESRRDASHRYRHRQPRVRRPVLFRGPVPGCRSGRSCGGLYGRPARFFRGTPGFAWSSQARRGGCRPARRWNASTYAPGPGPSRPCCSRLADPLACSSCPAVGGHGAAGRVYPAIHFLQPSDDNDTAGVRGRWCFPPSFGSTLMNRRTATASLALFAIGLPISLRAESSLERGACKMVATHAAAAVSMF